MSSNKNFDFSTNKKILVIEDNEINRFILTSILSECFDVIEAENGKVGLDILKENKKVISLIILDIQMPVMNGFEFLDAISKEQDLKSIPIIVATSDKEEEEKCLSLGASDFVSKPYSPRVIFNRTAALIRLSESISVLHETEFDATTKLFNKPHFDYLAKQLLNNQERYNKTGFIFIKINDFSYLESLYSNDDISKLIMHVAEKIKGSDFELLSSRYADDSFLCVCESESINKVAEELTRLLLENCPIKNVRFKCAIYKNLELGASITQIVDRLNKSISSISNDYVNSIAEFDENMVKKEERMHLLTENMEASLINSDFKVFFQPKHDNKTGELVGSEALVRWIHPVLGFISPGDFIPLFEENGFITKLDFFILENTCMILREMIDSGVNVVPVSINLSRRDLIFIEDIKVIDSILEKYGIDKDLIHFEITESMCGEGINVFEKAKLIRENGYKIEIDDFGSGYSSLGMITDIPMDYIKLDISFSRNLFKQKEVARTVILLAHALGVKTVAEGVESKEQLNLYNELGCDIIQGFYFSKPLPKDDYRKYLIEKGGN